MGCSSSSAVADPRDLKGRDPTFHDLYVLGRKLGEGAFGQVRVAKRKGGIEDYAVKIIDARGRDYAGEPTKEADRERVRATRDEIRCWEAVGTHEHCVHLQAHYFDKNLFYMVMEKCSCSLMDNLANMSIMMESDMSRIFTEMLLGIQHVHAVDIVHRDIKPDNFLLGADGFHVKLCDFGLAARMPTKGLLKGVYGTAPYMSPEMLSGPGYDKLTDVWSFGATAFLMVHGDFPYVPKTASAPAMKKAIVANKPQIRFVRGPTEELFFSRRFVDRATPFLQALLQRSPGTRLSASEALRQPFLCGEKTHSKDVISAVASPLAPAVRKARKATHQLKQAVNPIVQRNLDELLLRLQDRPGAAFAAHFFSETNGDDMIRAATVRENGSRADPRIQRKECRRSTHSGVISALVDVPADFKPTALHTIPNDEFQRDTTSTVTPGTSSPVSPCDSSLSFGRLPTGRPRAETAPPA